MSEEYLDIYDDDLNPIGSVTRKEAHQKGYWHYTFHCWIVLKTANGYQVMFQKRHPLKETNPNTFSVSAAGHILSGETIKDGVREVEEEIGVALSFSDLHFIGEFKTDIKTEKYHNREIGLVYYTVQPLPFSLFKPQLNEVSGLFLVNLDDFFSLFHENKEIVYGSGYEMWDDQAVMYETHPISLSDFSKEEREYYQMISAYLHQHLDKE